MILLCLSTEIAYWFRQIPQQDQVLPITITRFDDMTPSRSTLRKWQTTVSLLYGKQEQNKTKLAYASASVYSFVIIKIETGSLEWRDSTVGKVIAFYVVVLGSIPRSPYEPLEPQRVIPELKAKIKPWAKSGVVQIFFLF